MQMIQLCYKKKQSTEETKKVLDLTFYLSDLKTNYVNANFVERG